jgi:micrococcal nuclease
MNLFETVITFVGLLLAMVWPVASPDISSPTINEMAEVVSVIDGDTIIVSIDGREETVRYIGIDTPEPRREGAPECGSHEATEYNRSLVAGKIVELVPDVEDRDQYDRLLRYVYVGEGTDEVFVNEALIRSGFAVPLTIKPNDTYATAFNTIAATAGAARVGSWSACQDTFGD